MMNKRLQITMKEDVAKQLEKFAEKMGVSKSVIITLALQQYMNEK
ncbi:CopG family transcriptional regulator (plasmid) [Macrococcoides canis]|nr:CopG family transcriptional regulator [Macrococcus canis]